VADLGNAAFARIRYEAAAFGSLTVNVIPPSMDETTSSFSAVRRHDRPHDERPKPMLCEPVVVSD
jgi:hypothetical protein